MASDGGITSSAVNAVVDRLMLVCVKQFGDDSVALPLSHFGAGGSQCTSRTAERSPARGLGLAHLAAGRRPSRLGCQNSLHLRFGSQPIEITKELSIGAGRSSRSSAGNRRNSLDFSIFAGRPRKWIFLNPLNTNDLEKQAHIMRGFL